MLLVLNWDPKFEKRNMDSKGKKKKKDIDVFWHIHYFSTLKKKKKSKKSGM